MLIEKDKVVSFHFKVIEEGKLLESSDDGDPMLYMHGRNGLISGLESELAGKEVGDKFSVTLEPRMPMVFPWNLQNNVSPKNIWRLKGSYRLEWLWTSILPMVSGKRQ